MGFPITFQTSSALLNPPLSYFSSLPSHSSYSLAYPPFVPLIFSFHLHSMISPPTKNFIFSSPIQWVLSCSLTFISTSRLYTNLKIHLMLESWMPNILSYVDPTISSLDLCVCWSALTTSNGWVLERHLTVLSCSPRSSLILDFRNCKPHQSLWLKLPRCPVWEPLSYIGNWVCLQTGMIISWEVKCSLKKQ